MTVPVSAQTATNVVEGGYSPLYFDLFAGYQWFQFIQGSNQPQTFGPAGVWGERWTEDFSKYVGLQEMLQLGYNGVKYQPAGNVTSFSKVGDQNQQIFVDIMVHLRPRDAKIRPFLFIGPGWAHYNSPNFSKLTPGPGTPGPIVDVLPAGTGPQPSNSGFAFNYGLGVKYNATPKWGLRFDVTAMRSVIPHFNLPSYAATPGDLTVTEMGANNSITLSVGLIVNMKYHYPYVAPPPPPPPPPPAPRADVQVGAISGAHDVCPGETVQLSVTASGFAGQTPSYQWMVNGSPATGATSATFSVPTLTGGNKTVTVQVRAGDSSRTSAPVSFTVRPTPPPTIRFGVSPSTVTYGARINLAATATGSVCTNPVTVRYSGEGVSGSTFDSTTLNFDQSNRLRQQSRTVHITATATDSKNQTANAGADVTVTLTAQARRLDDIVFPQNSSRVNNCAKRLLLEELTPMLRSDPNAKVILIGHRDTTERARMNPPLDEARVINAAAVLSAGKGICPSLDLSRLSVNWVGTEQSSETRPALCGTSTNVKELGGQAIRQSDTHAQYRRVEIWIVPGGADMPAGMSGLKAAPATQIQAKGCPK